MGLRAWLRRACPPIPRSAQVSPSGSRGALLVEVGGTWSSAAASQSRGKWFNPRGGRPLLSVLTMWSVTQRPVWRFCSPCVEVLCASPLSVLPVWRFCASCVEVLFSPCGGSLFFLCGGSLFFLCGGSVLPVWRFSSLCFPCGGSLCSLCGDSLLPVKRVCMSSC